VTISTANGDSEGSGAFVVVGVVGVVGAFFGWTIALIGAVAEGVKLASRS
jgi:hypothetical protein